MSEAGEAKERMADKIDELRDDLKKAYADRDAARREAETLRAEVKTLERFKRRIAAIEREKGNIMWMYDRAFKHVSRESEDAIVLIMTDADQATSEVAAETDRIATSAAEQKARLNALLALILVGEP